jgi:hypothetical protein
MRELLLLAIHLLVTFTKLLTPGGVRAIAAESLLLKHQLLISNRSRQRAPNLTTLDRFLIALATLFVSPRRIPKLGALIKPATLFRFHKAFLAMLTRRNNVCADADNVSNSLVKILRRHSHNPSGPLARR